VAALPIESIAGPLADALTRERNFVLHAEPGAGKTTRVPGLLLEAGVIDEGEIWVSQPRRLAARMAAHRVASLLGEAPGETVGYQVRFETRASAATRIRFVTEGILARRLRHDPKLEGVAAVILDEFHERHVDVDVSLALLRRLQRSARDDLRIGVMSATLAPDPVAAFLACTPHRCEGRAFPIDTTFESRASDRPLPARVAQAVRDVTESGVDGSILVFLPGAREIRQCLESCEGIARARGLTMLPLHGDLPAQAQDRAVSPSEHPKLILSTNVAETSVTVHDVSTVIDSGLARRPAHNPWTGIPTLGVAKISRASATQRAGRAGRTRAGRCIRLYTQHDFERRPEFDAPELARLDLAQAMLDLRAADVADPRALAWFEPPPAASVDAAEALLRRLGAVEDDGRLTDVGRGMLRYPTHPRLARVMVEAAARGVAEAGAGVAALVSERPIRRRGLGTGDPATPVDVLADLEALDAVGRDAAEIRRRGLDPRACDIARRVRTQLVRAAKARRGAAPHDRDAVEEAIAYAVLTGFVDRVGAVRDAGRRVVLADGGSAELPAECDLAGADLVVVLGVQERAAAGKRTNVVRQAIAIETDWLLDACMDDVEERVEVTFDDTRERIVASETLRFGALVLEERALHRVPPEATAVLQDAARAKGPAAFVPDPAALTALHARTAFAHRYDPAVDPLDEARADAALAAACEGCRSFADIRAADLVRTMLGSLSPQGRAALEHIAPSHVTLPGGRRLAVRYALDRPPFVASRLQDFFGSREGPTIANGREPLVLHLLAPNRRAVQVTTDLAGFWTRHYPELRRALMRRYPKHDWPDDPVTARPSPPRRGRRT
jgi:ATP-dependent helicase HrpB